MCFLFTKDSLSKQSLNTFYVEAWGCDWSSRLLD